jgi:hypothetical protein
MNSPSSLWADLIVPQQALIFDNKISFLSSFPMALSDMVPKRGNTAANSGSTASSSFDPTS